VNKEQQAQPPKDSICRLPRGSRVLVSACLLGLKTRYKGDSKPCLRVTEVLRDSGLIPIPVCPEQLAGLPTPRAPSTFGKAGGDAVLEQEDYLLNTQGTDTTQAFIHGAQECQRIVQLCGCDAAIFKERSPSCGVHEIYAGSRLIKGAGVTTALLRRAGVRVLSEDEIPSVQ